MKKESGDVIILNLCNKKHDHMMYAYSDMECLHRHFLSFQAIFCSFAPLLTLEIKIWDKCKETHGDIILLHMCTIIKIIWCMVPEIWNATDRIFFSSWASFCPFTPLAARKNENIKKWKHPLEISFYTSVPKIMIIHNTVPEIWCVMDVIVIYILGYKISKQWKKAWGYHFTQVYQKSLSYVILLLRYGAHVGCNHYFLFWAVFCSFLLILNSNDID